ncbi:diguanylate cyclase domain-containing protein [Microbulbifer sp. Q7]|uniref:diguanylate cyclase domain-containing protein n=1 Tax=Microbulbifer sp. Q7 TaxID=1785091 RepID=UPI00082BB5E3|nr:diguanylate cyclase [Microbulbifer sp. Q7]
MSDHSQSQGIRGFIVLQTARLNTLRFKACLFSLLLVVAMCLFFILLGSGSLQSLLAKNREHRHLNFQFQVSGLLQQSRQEMARLAELIALSPRGRISSRDELRKAMNRQWELLQHSWELHSLKVYDAGGKPALSWGSPHGSLRPGQVSLVLLRGQPLELVHCEPTCVQSLAVPMRARGGDYVLQVDRPLAKQLRRFREMTGSDIGILSAVREAPPAQPDSGYLAGWQREVLSLTSRERLLPLLTRVSQEAAGVESLGRTRVYEQDSRQFDIRTMSMDADEVGPQFVFVEDVSGQVQHINDSVKLLLLFSVLGALIFSAAVAGTLWRPIERLRRLAEALPLLTNGRFADARRLIRPVKKSLDKYDELDVLDNTGLTVCDQLEDMSEMVGRKTAQLEQIAMHDSLTGLDNRYSLLEQLEFYLELARHQPLPVPERGYLFFIDLDDFKQVNDTLGHQGGDELLSVIARRLLSVMRCGDIVARLGGDEFCVFVRDIKGPDAYQTLADKLLNTVAQPVKIGDSLVEVTMSVGVVAIDDTAGTLEDILQKADMAMYHAKRHGKNKYQLFTADLPGLSDPVTSSPSHAIPGREKPAQLELVTSKSR